MEDEMNDPIAAPDFMVANPPPRLEKTTAKFCERLEQINDPATVTKEDIMVIKAVITYLRTLQVLATALSPPSLSNTLCAITLLPNELL
jgi:hypothetical protein